MVASAFFPSTNPLTQLPGALGGVLKIPPLRPPISGAAYEMMAEAVRIVTWDDLDSLWGMVHTEATITNHMRSKVGIYGN